jgi:hypothetical protein
MAADVQTREAVFGRIKIQITAEGDVVLQRRGQIGRGVPRDQRMWCIDQIEAAHISACNRRGEDAVCEARALRWALEELKHG